MWNSRVQRIVVGVIIAAVVVALALSLVSSAVAAEPPAAGPAAHRSGPAAPVAALPASGATPSPLPIDPALTGNGNPKPHTKTPQGEATQVTDGEHIGGLVGFIAFMLGGVLLLVRSRRRDRAERS